MEYRAEILELSKKAFISEEDALKAIAPYLQVYEKKQREISAKAKQVLEQIGKIKPSLIQQLLAKYPLKSKQGYAIMSLAECLQRVPDSKTAYELIDDKLKGQNWDEDSSVVGKAMNLAAKMGGNKLTITGLQAAFSMLGKEFILGETIEKAIKNAEKFKKKGYLISYDMLGEAARTDEKAEEYLSSYLKAIEAVETDSVSVKISALHPKYELLKYEQLKVELLPRLNKIIEAAKRKKIMIVFDAEEARRLDLMLLLFSEVYNKYEGVGLAVQAYNKRAIYVLQFLQKLASRNGKRIPVRLVKGAYWDSEIKKSQTDGVEDYPVYLSKAHTDLSYLACAKFMLDNMGCFYPQFATHNALTICSIMEIASGDYEFQRLYGMGDDLYDALKVKCRIYAPVGAQEDLLAYLIRRLLENGANNSFVNMVGNADIENTIKSPFEISDAKKVPLPVNIFPNRKNSKGIDLGNLAHIEQYQALQAPEVKVVPTSKEQCADIISSLSLSFMEWNWREDRSQVLNKIADLYEENEKHLIAILMTEGKKNLSDAISEVREAVDFCRYYAVKWAEMSPQKMAGITGEENIYKYEGRGVFACISPWNFPLAIFTGQVVAALVAGNCVLAKPAEQTPKIAAFAVGLMYEAGVPNDVLKLVVGKGSVIGDAITSHPRTAGICFTGSTETAKHIAKSVTESNPSLIPLIAETGGQNCMIVDSTTLIEASVDDIIVSAFGSAGQRCSALRVCYVQDDIADEVIKTLKGAMAALEVSDKLSADVREVIDERAKAGLLEHVEKMKKSAKLIYGCGQKEGCYVPPHVFEIDSIKWLEKEVFGPVLHLIRFKSSDLEKVIADVNSTGYGLTFGIQSRIQSRVDYLASKIRAGNIYVNRTMIGAVVESQAFGGMGLSGTGFKAGGPDYLKRFCVEKVVTTNKTAIGGNLDLI